MGDQPMWVQRPLVAVIGAAIGAVGFLGIADLIRPAQVAAENQPSINSQPISTEESIMTKNPREELATALMELANAVSRAAPVIIGSQSIAIAGHGSSGTIIGSEAIAIGKPGFAGTVIGHRSVATSSDTPVNNEMAQALRMNAEQVRYGTATRSQIEVVLASLSAFAMQPDVSQAITMVNQALSKSDLK